MAEVKPLLSNAIAAVRTVCVGFNEEGEDVYVGPNTAEEIATAVLNATAAPDLFEALTEARLTLSLTRTNIMVEMKKSEGAAYRWEGVPELLEKRIDQCDAALSKATAQQEGR